MFRASALLLGILFAVPSLLAQNTTTSSGTQTSTTTIPPAPIQRDPQAVTLANQSLQAIAGATVLQDATVQAAASWVAGSDEESGTAMLQVKGSQEGRTVLSLTSGQRQEIRNALQGPEGAWTGPDGTWYASALHNCWTDASWFFPAFTLQTALNDPTVSLIYVGPDSFGGGAAIHLILYRTVSGSAPTTIKLIQRISTVHVFLDGTSGLPVGLRFTTHPDDNALLDIPVEIHFSNYKAVSGVQVPFHIQKFLQGTPLLDLSVTAVQINSGLTDGNFALPAITTTTESTTTSGGGR
jgi:hypothetical protein